MQLRTILAGIALAGLAGAVPAQAEYLSASFTGTVDGANYPLIGTTAPDGSPISGSFVYDVTGGAFLSFNVGSYSLPSGAFSSYVPQASTSTASAIFTASQSINGNGAATGTTLQLDLEAPFPCPCFDTTNLDSFLTNPALFGSLFLDPTAGGSSFSYGASDANGTTVTALTADITSISATVPEPAGIGAFAVGMIGLLAARRRI